MADRMGNLLDEMDQRRKIVEKKMGWSLDPVDWFLNSDQIIQLVLERFPELLQELSFPPSPSPSSDKQIYAPPPISEPPPIITIKVIQTSPVIQTPPMTYNPPQSPVISPPPTITTIPQTQTDLQTPHNSNRSSLPFKTIEPPPQTPSQSMPPIESLLPPKPPEPPNEFMQSDLKVLHTNKRYGRPSKVRFRTRLHRNLCFHSTMTIAGERHQQEMQARKKSSTCVESRLETRGHLMQNNATRDRGKEIAGDGSSFQDYGKPCIIWEELVVYVHSGFQEARHENRTTPSNSLNPNWLIVSLV